MDFTPVRQYLLGLQDRIVSALEAEGGDTFLTDAWSRDPGGPLEGDGRSRLVEGGVLLERGGCNFSHVRGRGQGTGLLPLPAGRDPAHLVEVQLLERGAGQRHVGEVHRVERTAEDADAFQAALSPAQSRGRRKSA